MGDYPAPSPSPELQLTPSDQLLNLESHKVTTYSSLSCLRSVRVEILLEFIQISITAGSTF